HARHDPPARITLWSAAPSATPRIRSPWRARSQPSSTSMSRLVFGLHPVLEAMTARRREVSLVYTSEDSVEKQARVSNVPCERKSKPELDEIAGPGARHQGAIAVVGEYPYVALEEIPTSLVLALDSVTDPQNLGALVRSAHVLGADGVIVPK